MPTVTFTDSSGTAGWPFLLRRLAFLESSLPLIVTTTLSTPTMTTSVSSAQAEPTCCPTSLANPLVPAPPMTALSPGMESFDWIRDLKDALANRALTARGAGGLTPTATSPVPSGIANKAVVSQPACGTMWPQLSSALASTQPITAPSRPYHQVGLILAKFCLRKVKVPARLTTSTQAIPFA